MANVLVIDDDPSVVRLISLLLLSDGHSVKRANNGRVGLDSLHEAYPDLIVLDLQMPELDGRAFYRLAREDGYKGPVLLLSAFGAQQAREELGANASLAKPFEPDVLLNTVSNLIGVG
jgi:CheY-like chemotaxis protein